MRVATLATIAFLSVVSLATAQGALGKLKVTVTANGEAAAATVEVLPAAGGAAVAHGEGGKVLDVPAGTFEVRATLTEAIDDPVQTKSGVVVTAGAQADVSIDFEVARVTLVCRKGGADVTGTVKIRRPGASGWLPEVRCGEAFLVSGGTYEAQVTVTGAAQPVSIDRVQIMSGATQRLPLNLP